MLPDRMKGEFERTRQEQWIGEAHLVSHALLPHFGEQSIDVLCTVFQIRSHKQIACSYWCCRRALRLASLGQFMHVTRGAQTIRALCYSTGSGVRWHHSPFGTRTEGCISKFVSWFLHSEEHLGSGIFWSHVFFFLTFGTDATRKGSAWRVLTKVRPVVKDAPIDVCLDPAGVFSAGLAFRAFSCLEFSGQCMIHSSGANIRTWRVCVNPQMCFAE